MVVGNTGSSRKILGVGLLHVLLLAAGCANNQKNPTGADNESQSATTPVQAPELGHAMDLLQQGEPAEAEAELKAYLSGTPDSRSARFLLAQIEQPVAELYPRDSFTVTLSRNDTLSGLSARYLGNSLAFYGLARYNGISRPSMIVAGERVRIPKTAFAIAALAGHNQREGKNTSFVPQPTGTVAPTPDLRTTDASADMPVLAPSPVAPTDYLEAFKTALLDGRYVDAAKAADSGRIAPGKGRGAALANTYFHAAEIEKNSDTATAAIYARRAGALYLNTVKNAEMARIAFQLAIAINASDAVAQAGLRTANEKIVSDYTHQGAAAFQHQDLDGAIAAWNKVLSIDPYDSNARLNRAQAVQLKANLKKMRG